VTTPSSTIGVRGGICLFDVDGRHTTSTFAFGHSMTVQGQGFTETVTRPGFGVTTQFGFRPGQPFFGGQNLGGWLAQLEGRHNTSNSGGSGGGGQGGNQGGGNADQGAQRFSQQNSGQGPGNGPPSGPQGQGPGGGFGNNNSINNAVSNSNLQNQGNSTQGNTSTPSPIQTLNGYSAGVILETEDDGPTARVPSVTSAQTSDVTVTTNTSTGKGTSTIIVRGSGTNAAVATLQFGGNGSSSSVTNANTYTMSQSTTSDSTFVSGGTTYTISTTSALNSSSVSGSSTAPSSSVTSGLSSTCNCSYLTWGWWNTTFASPVDNVDGDNDVTVKVTSAPYVVGSITQAVQMPQTGSATYSGFMTGNVWTGGSTVSSVTGSYSNTWNFASRAGTFTGSFDGVSYSGTNTAVSGSGGVNFTGSFSGGSRTGSLAGSFFGPNAQNQGGAFSITGTNYNAAGIFAGSKR
jgi:hypothetical protein